MGGIGGGIRDNRLPVVVGPERKGKRSRGGWEGENWFPSMVRKRESSEVAHQKKPWSLPAGRGGPKRFGRKNGDNRKGGVCWRKKTSQGETPKRRKGT